MAPDPRVRGRALAVALASAGLALLSSPPTSAHQYWPGYLQLKETGSESYDVMFKVPATGQFRLPIYAQLPASCDRTVPLRTSSDGAAHVERWSVRCEGGLVGQTLLIEGLAAVPTDALVRIERLDGTAQMARLTPDDPSVVVEAAADAGQVAGTYFVIGVDHILLGIDHLLFVLALLIITRGAWRLVKTVTAFTVAHSITLALATLGFVHVPSAPVEAVIALSIVFVAAEIVRTHRGRIGITERAPWVVAFVFGLLHGFGFAGALSEVGLPENHIPLALLFFNVGVEAGQLAFIAGVLAAMSLAIRLPLQWPRWAELVPAYAIGGTAMVWVIERVGSFAAA
jgi:hydrogenase/urease accessory protein HupE